MFKKATQLSYNITAEEKLKAESALLCFKHTEKKLKAAISHLDIIYTPFKNHADIKSEEIVKYRAALRRFRDKSIENFNEFKKLSFNCVNIMQIFSSDTQIFKLIKTFISIIDELENCVNKFIAIFDDLKSKTFAEDVVKSIDKINEKSSQLEDIVNNRINTHIQNNILASTWIDDLSKDLNKKIEKKNPIMMDLFRTRQEKLKGD